MAFMVTHQYVLLTEKHAESVGWIPHFVSVAVLD